MPLQWILKALAAMIPLLIGALVTIAWQNSHTMALLTREYEDLRVDLERTKASLEPGRTIMLRFDHAEAELAHLRELVEQRLNCPPPK
jgi:hypothetical protein